MRYEKLLPLLSVGSSPKNSGEQEVVGTCICLFAVPSIFAAANGGAAHLFALVETESSQSMTKKPDPFAYVAKYVVKQGGDLHFGGTLEHVNFSKFRESLANCGGTEIVRSPDLSRNFFHLSDPRRKK
jgi:hypothetical protein